MHNFMSRGGMWVIGQFALLAVVGALALATRSSLSIMPGWLGLLSGTIIVIGGLAVGAKSFRDLGAALTAMPEPLREATLVQSGIYAFVRHPIYLAVFLLVGGWGLICASWQGLALSIVVLAYFNAKANVEERMLSARYTAYGTYRERVGKLFPKLRG